MNTPDLKIVIINHSFQVYYYYRRWQLFARQHPNIDVYLLAPETSKWYNSKSYTYGNGGTTIKGKSIEESNFHIHLIHKKDIRGSHWFSPDFKRELTSIRPDVVYHIGSHLQFSLMQVIRLTKKYLPTAKILAFSMRGPHHNIANRNQHKGAYNYIKNALSCYISQYMIKYINKNCDAIFCHYPDAVNSFREEGYTGPIYMQTQVGVNEEWFHPDEQARKEVRNKYNLTDEFVFGSATRFTPDKGILDILEALPSTGNWKYFMMGSGNKEDTDLIKKTIKDKNLDKKVIMTGFVDWYDMAKYWNAIDCAIHVPRTTHHWIETFSLTVVQAMITGKPIIGNTSGSVPYQIGDNRLIVQEGDNDALRNKITWVLNHQAEANAIGADMRKFAHNSFSIQHLNDMFYDTLVEDILTGNYDTNKLDMTKYKKNI